MAARPVIFVLVCTIDDGILRVPQVLLPAEDGVRYVVSWQQTTPAATAAPGALMRDDVTLTTLSGRGLCRNRNHAMEVAMSQLADPLEDVVFVLADDDERVDAEAFAKIRALYGNHPRLDGALMRMRSSADGTYFKAYPPKMVRYGQHPRSYYPASVEMTFRSRVWAMGVRFDERFGLGSAELCAGEEDVWLTDMLRRGLRVYVVPEDLCSTNPVTTGSRAMEAKVLRSKGAVYGYRHGWPRAFLRSLREALSLAVRQRASFFFIFRNIWYGVKYIRS